MRHFTKACVAMAAAIAALAPATAQAQQQEMAHEPDGIEVPGVPNRSRR